jgi:hypothetical protein
LRIRGHIPGDIFCDILGLSWLANPASKEKEKKKAGMGKRKEMVIIFFSWEKKLVFKWLAVFNAV